MIRFDANLEVERLVPPVEVVTELNRRFMPQDVGYFTMIYGILDARTHEIRMCQAGHPSPLLVKEDGDDHVSGGWRLSGGIVAQHVL